MMAPRMDYDEWTPIGRGDPLKNDPTYDYVPPVLDKVHYWISPAARTSESPAASESQIMALATAASKKPSPTLKPGKSEMKRYHTETKAHYQGYGPYISGSKHPNRGRPQYIPLATYSTYKYPRPPLTMLVPPPPSQPVTYPPTTEEEPSQITTDLPKSTDRNIPAPTNSLSLQTGSSWKTPFPAESTQAETTKQDTSTVYYDPVKKETVYKQVSPAIDIDTSTGQTSSTGLSSTAAQTWSSTAFTTLAQTLSTNPSSILVQTSSSQPSTGSPTGQTSSRQPSTSLTTGQTLNRASSTLTTVAHTGGQTTASSTLTTRGQPLVETSKRQPPSVTTGYTLVQTSSLPSSQTTKMASSLFDLLLKRDSPPAVTSPATPAQPFAAHPFLTHYKPQEASKAPAYLIIQGHSKVKKYGATKLDKISGIPLQDSNEISSHQDSDSNDILRRKTRDLSFEDFLPIDGTYFKSTFEDYYDTREEASGLNSIPTR